MKFVIVEHHPEGDCDGDYYAVTVEQDGECVAEYGDAYHDKGRTRAEQYVDTKVETLKELGVIKRATIRHEYRDDGDRFV